MMGPPKKYFCFWQIRKKNAKTNKKIKLAGIVDFLLVDWRELVRRRHMYTNSEEKMGTYLFWTAAILHSRHMFNFGATSAHGPSWRKLRSADFLFVNEGCWKSGPHTSERTMHGNRKSRVFKAQCEREQEENKEKIQLRFKFREPPSKYSERNIRSLF